MFRFDVGPGDVQPKSTCTHGCCNHINFFHQFCLLSKSQLSEHAHRSSIIQGLILVQTAIHISAQEDIAQSKLERTGEI